MKPETVNTANRITAATLGGAIATICLWILEEYAGVVTPAPVTVAITTVILFLTQVAWSRFAGFAGGGYQTGFASVPAMLLAGLVALLLLAGCTSTSRPTNFHDSAGAVILAIDTASDTLFDLCRNEVPGGECAPGALISTEDNQRAAAELQEALDFVSLALQLNDQGEPDQATSALHDARRLIRTAEAILGSYQ